MRNRYARNLLLCIAAAGLFPISSTGFGGDDSVALPKANSVMVEGITFNIPDGWSIKQDARSSGVIILGLGNGSDYLQVYAKQGGPIDMKATFMNGATLVRDVSRESHGAYNWSVMQSKRSRSGAPDVFVTSFMTTKGGSVIYGFSRSSTASASQAVVNGILDQTR